MGVDADGEIAQDIFVEPLLALDLGEGRGRRVDVEQRHVRLAVLADAVGEGLHPPIFGLGDLPAHLLDDAFVLRGERFDLLRAGVLAREVDVFVERHGLRCLSFWLSCAIRRLAI